MNRSLEWVAIDAGHRQSVSSEPRNGFIAIVSPAMGGAWSLRFIDMEGVLPVGGIGFGIYAFQCDAMQAAIAPLNNLPYSHRLGLVNVPEKMIIPDEGYYSGGYI